MANAIEPLQDYIIDGPLYTGFCWGFNERNEYRIHRIIPMKAPSISGLPQLLVSTFKYASVRTFEGSIPTISVIKRLASIGEAMLEKKLIYSWVIAPIDQFKLPKISGEYEDLETKRLAHFVGLETLQIDTTAFDEVGDVHHEHD